MAVRSQSLWLDFQHQHFFFTSGGELCSCCSHCHPLPLIAMSLSTTGAMVGVVLHS